MDSEDKIVRLVPKTGQDRATADEPRVIAFKPRPVAGDKPFIRCRDIHGPCCNSCHDEADGGGEPLIAVFGDRHVVTGLVCCQKLGEANRRNRRPPVQRSARLSTPSGECFR